VKLTASVENVETKDLPFRSSIYVEIRSDDLGGQSHILEKGAVADGARSDAIEERIGSAL
jgi:hypothetical protein